MAISMPQQFDQPSAQAPEAEFRATTAASAARNPVGLALDQLIADLVEARATLVREDSAFCTPSERISWHADQVLTVLTQVGTFVEKSSRTVREEVLAEQKNMDPEAGKGFGAAPAVLKAEEIAAVLKDWIDYVEDSCEEIRAALEPEEQRDTFSP